MKHFVVAFFIVCLCGAALAEDVVVAASNDDEPGAKEGVRPYEMDWAQRTAPTHPLLVDFEDLTGWRVRCTEGAETQLYRSREEKLFGEYTAKVVYHGTSSASHFVIEPPEPIAIPESFTAVDLWVRGNNWGWIEPAATAHVGVCALVRDAKNEMYRIQLGVVDFDYWFLFHATCVSPDGTKNLYDPIGTPNDGVIDFPASFVGLEVNGCASRPPAKLYLDALSFYTMQYPKLTNPGLAARPEVTWPTTPDGMLPTCKLPVTTRVIANIKSGVWTAEAADEHETVRYTYKPSDGTLGDVTTETRGQRFQPCLKGGVAFRVGSREVHVGDPALRMECQETRDMENGCYARWCASIDGKSLVFDYAFRVKGKSLVVDVTAAQDSDAVQLDIGLAAGLQSPKTVFFPYLTYGDDWPKVVCANGAEGPVFLLSLTNFYASDASELFGAPRLHDTTAVGYAGGAVYHPTTAGKLNALREEFHINVSGDVQEVLPNIPNPDSDMRDVAREYVWRNIGSLFQNEMLLKYKGYGIDKFIACHHEVGWREGGESFTQRDRPAPSLGDERLKEYAAFVRGLGYRFGTYTNYVDFAPVNANWNENEVCLNSDGTWQRAWPRCYAFKPSCAVEREADYAKRINERYGTTAQYCDVQTAYTPWGRTDYDARTEGAGMFRAQYNAFALLLQNESKAHQGPVFSEGNYHWFYAGIVDGDYATIVPYGRGWQLAQLVDFDLLKMHPKMTDFGMGMPQMYYGASGEWTKERTRLSPYFDRFHTATIAFGHIGFLADDWGFDGTLKSYYLLQALQQRYVGIPVKSIEYFNGKALVDTSAAIAGDAYQRQQIRTEYDNGLVTWCNLSLVDEWTIEVNGVAYTLPPGGFAAFRPDDILAYSAIAGGVRHELVWCRDFLYLDTRGELVRTPVVATRGTVAVKPDGDKAWWVIPATKCEEVSVARAWLHVSADTRINATACKLDGSAVGPATVLPGTDEVTVMPVTDESVVKYRLVEEGTQETVITDLRSASRTVLTTNSVSTAVTVKLGAEMSPEPLAIAWSCGNPGAEPYKADKVDLVRSEDKLTASGTIDLLVPGAAPVHQRCWCRFQPLWLGDDSARWIDVVPLPAFEITMPTGTFQVATHTPFDIGANVLSHLPGAVAGAFRLEADGILEKPLGREVFVRPEEVQPLIWRLRLPNTPASVRLRMTANAAGHGVECVRYMTTRPATWVVADLLRLPLSRGTGIRSVGEISYDAAATGGMVDLVRDTLGGVSHEGLFTHPPYKTGVGYVYGTFNVTLPAGQPMLTFALGFRSGSTSRDGCVFKVLVGDQGTENEVFSEQYATLDAWAPRSVDLSGYADRTVTIKLLADVGPRDDSTSDWAVWGEPRVVMSEPTWKAELGTEAKGPVFGPSPKFLGRLLMNELATLRSAQVSLETAGVDGGAYTPSLFFNGVPMGMLPVSGGDTEWRAASVPLTPEALATVRPTNMLVIKNPGGDFMKIRNVCLQFELQDGRQGASLVDLGPYSSDKAWKYTEGTSVNLGEDLPEIALCVPMR